MARPHYQDGKGILRIGSGRGGAVEKSFGLSSGCGLLYLQHFELLDRLFIFIIVLTSFYILRIIHAKYLFCFPT